MENWRGLANTYEGMAKSLPHNGVDTIPRATFYRIVAGVFRTHVAEIEEIYR